MLLWIKKRALRNPFLDGGPSKQENIKADKVLEYWDIDRSCPQTEIKAFFSKEI